MTCIVGLVHNDKVYIGGDSAGISNRDITVQKGPKVFKTKDFLIGYTSSFRMGQLLRYKFEPPQYSPDEDIVEYMVTAFIDAVRECFKDGGYARQESGEEYGGYFLVGYKGRLFHIAADYQVGESLCGYTATGCGEDYAKGSLFSSVGKDPDERVYIALSAASYFSTDVCGPFVIEHV